MKRALAIAAVLVMAFTVVSCSRTQKGAVIGGGTGAVLGGIIGKQSGNTAVGAIMGAAIGGAAGAAIGNYMDKQAEELEQELQNAKVERVGEGIKITFDSGILFDVNKADLRPAAQTNLTNLAQVLNKYDDTNILIEGHTDSDGTEEYNQTLSERRASAVQHYLAGLQVSSSRISMHGYGESQPVASNDSTEGKQQNRRVEIAIMANEDLKKKAEDGKLG